MPASLITKEVSGYDTGAGAATTPEIVPINHCEGWGGSRWKHRIRNLLSTTPPRWPHLRAVIDSGDVSRELLGKVRASGNQAKPPGKNGDPGKTMGGDGSPPRKRQGKLRDQERSGDGGPGSFGMKTVGRATGGPQRPPVKGRPSRARRRASRCRRIPPGRCRRPAGQRRGPCGRVALLLDDVDLQGEAADQEADAASSSSLRAGGPLPIRPATRLPNLSGAMGRSISLAPSQAQSVTSNPRWAGNSELLRPRGTRLPVETGQPRIHTGAMGRSIYPAPSQALR